MRQKKSKGIEREHRLPLKQSFSPCFISHPLRSAPCQNSMSPVEGLEPRAWARNDMVLRRDGMRRRARRARRTLSPFRFFSEECRTSAATSFLSFFLSPIFFPTLARPGACSPCRAASRCEGTPARFCSRASARTQSALTRRERERQRERKKRTARDRREGHERPRECHLEPFSCPLVVLGSKRKALCLL